MLHLTVAMVEETMSRRLRLNSEQRTVLILTAVALAGLLLQATLIVATRKATARSVRARMKGGPRRQVRRGRGHVARFAAHRDGLV